MFEKILIANRGEIACRVIRTARRMGIRTVAVHSDADANAMHVQMADEACRIGEAEVTKSYLLGDVILEAARRTGAEAIHPGYGFLSENAKFAEAVEKAGLTFIGPTADSIRRMGLKDAAKAIMEEANVPVVPGYHGDGQDPAELAKEAERIGYPVLIKAVAGGGGKGMRRVDAAKDFQKALEGAQREAKNAFGEERVLIEKYLVKPRHIEVQVFGDTHGNAVYVFERDCSIQRRHQKVIEEAPAPGMTDAMRKAMGEAAVAAARAIDYRGAGTIEFIADVSEGLREDRFYFMEMNTRLQVEHPVSEMISGQDLVEWQIRVAAGEKLPLAQEDLAINGHAVEARLYAENPQRMFLPATGRLDMLRFPDEGEGVRVDTGVREGDSVTPFYDPMIAKLIAHGRDRAEANRKLAGMLDRTRVIGLTTNVFFLKKVITHAAFDRADLDTGFIERFEADLIPPKAEPDARSMALGVLAILAERQAAHTASHDGDPFSPWDAIDGWRLNDEGREVVKLRHGETETDVLVHYQAGGGLKVDAGGESWQASFARQQRGELTATLNGDRAALAYHLNAPSLTLIHDGALLAFHVVDPMEADMGDEGVGGAITAPLPGKIIKVSVKPGDDVKKGDPLMILEAMKMEHTISASTAGKVAEVNFAEGDQVEEGTTLIALETA
ncbi:acetyl/propionyl/methylcrotonyl-CoA carboxylase subunit alpha [Minwuia sp.]|uniref:acetyl/propionyl/methylcrotonyl-CoA carboxylase subunit alpha n=1 Tax=Minwuia sp. TaxID=2493630 RepID=UPI003A90D297